MYSNYCAIAKQAKLTDRHNVSTKEAVQPRANVIQVKRTDWCNIDPKSKICKKIPDDS